MERKGGSKLNTCKCNKNCSSDVTSSCRHISAPTCQSNYSHLPLARAVVTQSSPAVTSYRRHFPWHCFCGTSCFSVFRRLSGQLRVVMTSWAVLGFGVCVICVQELVSVCCCLLMCWKTSCFSLKVSKTI